MRTQLQVADIGDFLDQPLNAMVATLLSNGEIMLIPQWHEWRDGGFNLFTLAGGLKHRRMERHPQVSVTVAENSGIRRGVQVRGIAHFSYDDVTEMCQRIALRYMPSERVARFLQSLETVAMVHVRVEPGKLQIWDSADGVPGWITEIAKQKQKSSSS